MERRVILHVGTPKSGTSLLQHALHVRRPELRAAGVLYPGDRPDAHFLAALDLMQLTWGGLEEQAVGAWGRLVEEVRGWRGTAVISHEILGAATDEQAARAVTDLSEAGVELHLVVSARDLTRQVPAEWQENLKHRRTLTYEQFLTDLRDPERPTAIADWFWRVQDPVDVTRRWGSALPPERVHLVTVPPAGSAPTALWDRFLDAFDLHGLGLAPQGRANTSLGVPESAMLRRLNTRLNGVVPDELVDPEGAAEQAPGDSDADHDSAQANAVGGLPGEHYRPLVRELLVHNNLSGAVGSPRLVLPPDLAAWTGEVSRGWVEELRRRGYRVHGDLDELLGTPPTGAFHDPDHVDEHLVSEAALDSLALLLAETARLREVERDLAGAVADQGAQLDRVYGTRTFRAKKKLVDASQDSAVARWGYAGYRRLRRRSSRSA